MHKGTSFDGRGSAKPISYADNEHPRPVPNFHENLPSVDIPLHNGHGYARRDGNEKESKSYGQANLETRPSISEDVEKKNTHMTNVNEESEDMYDLIPKKEKSIEEIRAEKRRKWAAIREAVEKKDRLLQQAILNNTSERTTPNVASPAAPTERSMSPMASPFTPDLGSFPTSPDVMEVDKQRDSTAGSVRSTQSPFAANYDPTKDMLDDRDRFAQKTQHMELRSDAYNETSSQLFSALPDNKAIPVKKQKKEFDMFASESESESDPDEEAGKAIAEQAEANAKGVVLDEKLLDNWDDKEAYYKLIPNELVNGARYRLIRNLGRGVFANVVEAEDVTVQGDGKHKIVAIKMVRKNDLMRKSSQKEMDILRKVNEADPQDKRYVIRLLGSFDHKGHLCAVFEHMSMNLRDLLKEETNNHGLSIQAVQTYARQMFAGLQHLQNCQIIHCDLKPDNVLVSLDKKTVKLADFGTAIDKRDIMERSEYVVSRFYRAPEIILGMNVGHGIDMWAIGCTIYELWTGKILFTGKSNNHMLNAFMNCLGWPSEKLLKKGNPLNVTAHFEFGASLKFISKETDSLGRVSISKTGKPYYPILPDLLEYRSDNNDQMYVRVVEQQRKVWRDLKTRITEPTKDMTRNKPSSADLTNFANLLAACLNWNPQKRIQPKDALLHKFFPQHQHIMMPRASVVKPATVKQSGGSFRR